MEKAAEDEQEIGENEREEEDGFDEEITKQRDNKKDAKAFWGRRRRRRRSANETNTRALALGKKK